MALSADVMLPLLEGYLLDLPVVHQDHHVGHGLPPRQG